jgi:hypothetical protein
VQKRCDQNRKRTKRRAICCPIHGCYMDSVSKKYPLFADRAEQLEQRGMPRPNALRLVSTRMAVPIEGEWIEALWCEECQETKWYHVCKGEDRSFRVAIAPRDLWQYASGAVDPEGNPSVGQFTRRNSRMLGCNITKDFQFIV